jgi:hypothetical protein
MRVADMIDPLALIDEAIERMSSIVSSRCSRSGVDEESPMGTLKPLIIDTVPVAPVVPGQKQETHESTALSDEFSRLNLLTAAKEVPRASTIQKTTGLTGTTGTGPNYQHLSVPKTNSENGNNGNNLGCSPPVALDSSLRAALQRPVSWSDPAARPSVGCFCSCCKGRRWWCEGRKPKGWRCWTCHPPDGATPDDVVEVRT